MKKIIEEYHLYALLIIILLSGFLLRLYGLKSNYSFWVDEAGTARFGKAVLETGFPRIKETGYSEGSFFLTDYLTGVSFWIFGVSEFSARLPEVIFGTVLIFIVFLLSKNLLNEQVGLAAAFFTAFSYLQIAWSRQARGYVILEVFFLSALLFLYRFSKRKRLIEFLCLSFSLILSVLTHILALSLVPTIIIYFFLDEDLRKNFFSSKKWMFLGVIVLIVIVAVTKDITIFYLTKFLPAIDFRKNYIWYYHSLFWRQYPLLTFLSLISFIYLGISKKKKEIFLFAAASLPYLFMVSFLLHVPFEKYVLVIFSISFILSSYSLSEISRLTFKDKNHAVILLFLFVGLILLNGNKFTLRPKFFYSLNFDMREIPEIDYKKIYRLVNNKSEGIEKGKIAIIDIDSDIPVYYLGEGRLTHIPRNDVAEKVSDANTGAVYIHSLGEFLKVRNKYQYGFIELIEHNFRFYPEGMVDYVRKNLNLEIREEYAGFSPDWNRWPVELYSWGFDDNGKIQY